MNRIYNHFTLCKGLTALISSLSLLIVPLPPSAVLRRIMQNQQQDFKGKLIFLVIDHKCIFERSAKIQLLNIVKDKSEEQYAIAVLFDFFSPYTPGAPTNGNVRKIRQLKNLSESNIEQVVSEILKWAEYDDSDCC